MSTPTNDPNGLPAFGAYREQMAAVTGTAAEPTATADDLREKVARACASHLNLVSGDYPCDLTSPHRGLGHQSLTAQAIWTDEDPDRLRADRLAEMGYIRTEDAEREADDDRRIHVAQRDAAIREADALRETSRMIAETAKNRLAEVERLREQVARMSAGNLSMAERHDFRESFLRADDAREAAVREVATLADKLTRADADFDSLADQLTDAQAELAALRAGVEGLPRRTVSIPTHDHGMVDVEVVRWNALRELLANPTPEADRRIDQAALLAALREQMTEAERLIGDPTFSQGAARAAADAFGTVVDWLEDEYLPGLA